MTIAPVTTASNRFQTRFTFNLALRRKSDCLVSVQKNEKGELLITLSDQSTSRRALIKREFDRICTQFYAKFLKGVPPKKTKWLYLKKHIPLVWDGERFYSESKLNKTPAQSLTGSKRASARSRRSSSK